ncbi:glycosyltransferase [Pseudodesulfovibrio cashew]|uniref:Glycosyltransferase n=1 Tax=Pseudodesulfovibrio cashew TaxID=2678688 RepID=A0A6I6JFD5_9BACT|nr:glycosyltransferase [Pseudodesulfovibrio cashew]QGY38707.1 glycosyltransferase [Pseudodesulfovibrio cashew]
MRVLFTHNNFPAQFRHLCEHLGRTPGNSVVFATRNPRPEWSIPGVVKAVFEPDGPSSGESYAPAARMEESVRHGVGMLRLCHKLRAEGFVPDLIVGHSGWGQTLFLRDAFPEVPFLGYFEWYYDADGEETLFDGRPRSAGERAPLRLRNTAILHDLVSCTAGITPTRWQKAQFPQEFHSKLTRLHDGINTRYFAPAEEGPLPPEALELPDTDLTGATELVTYCSRGLEPYRGFPQFYESLPAILDARPGCHVLIVGEDRVCYSPTLPDNGSYKDLMRGKVAVDESRVHFTGPLPYGLYRQVLQASTVHVYLTWPFVLSWSFLEALSCGCLVVGSDTAPVREVLVHERNGLLTDFRSPAAIAQSVITGLEHREDLAPLRTAARQTILDDYCLSKSLPAQLDLMTKLVQAGANTSNPKGTP